MLVPNRNYSSPEYRYGFQGQEKDDEVKGSGNNYNFGSRTAYDPRIARFTSVDPRVRQYPSMSPYVFAANNPIYYEDQEGEGPIPFRFKKYLKQDSYYATGLLAGIGDGLIEVLDMAAGVVQAGSAWNPFNAYAYTQEASQMRAEHREMGNMVIKLFSDEELRDKMYANIKKEVGDWFDQTTFQGTAAEAGYQHGKLLFDGLTSIIGVSELKYLMKTGSFSKNALKLLAKRARKLIPSKGWASKIFTNSLSTRKIAEEMALKTKYKGFKDANEVIKKNNPIFDLFDGEGSTIMDNLGNIVDITTTSAKDLSTSQFYKKLNRLGGLKGKIKDRVLQIYVKAGQYSKEDLNNLSKKLSSYINDNLKGKNVTFSIDEIK